MSSASSTTTSGPLTQSQLAVIGDARPNAEGGYLLAIGLRSDDKCHTDDPEDVRSVLAKPSNGSWVLPTHYLYNCPSARLYTLTRYQSGRVLGVLDSTGEHGFLRDCRASVEASQSTDHFNPLAAPLASIIRARFGASSIGPDEDEADTRARTLQFTSRGLCSILSRRG